MPCTWYQICPLRRFEQQGSIDSSWREQYCKSDRNWKNCARYQAESAGKAHPDNLMPDGSIAPELKDA